MADRICPNPKCGASNLSTASFCRVCDTFLGWPVNREGPSPEQAPAPPPPRPDGVRPPAVSIEQSEVVVSAAEPGTFTMLIKNDSSIVDSYVIQAIDPPRWLAVTHGETNLLPDKVRAVPVTLEVRPRSLAVAQRTEVPLSVCSAVDPTMLAEVTVTVVVPKSGPPATLSARPTLIQLENRGEGSFALRFDNQAANFPRRYRLAASDPEGVVRFDFVPPAVDVVADGAADATVRFVAPEPPPGRDATRQITVTGTDDEGLVSVQVTVAQATSPEPERVPLRLRLEPSQVRAVDATTARVDIVVDNRAGHADAAVRMRGQDPANAVSFAFDYEQLTLPAGRAVRFRAHVSMAPPPRGQSVTRPFSVVAVEGDSEVEVSGTFELTSHPAAITSAQLRLVPDHVLVSSRAGTFAVDLDNRDGLEPLEVRLSAADEYGRARFAFFPEYLVVAPGHVSHARLTVQHPRPAGGIESSRRIRVTATSGVDSIQADAVFTQQVANRRRLWAVALVLLGALLVVAGAWLYAAAAHSALSEVEAAVEHLVSAALKSKPKRPDIQTVTNVMNVTNVTNVAFLSLVLLSLPLILLGINSRTGRAVRIGALIAALAAVGAIAALAAVNATVSSSGKHYGIALVVAGSVIAFVGGILLQAG